MANYGEWKQLIGIAGTDPEIVNVTIKGEPAEIVKFRMAAPGAAPQKTEDGWANTDEWYSVAVFREDLQPVVLAEVYKGAKVAVEGSVTVKEIEGKTFRDLSATNVYITQRLGGQRTAASQRRVAAATAAGEDLGF